MLELESVTYLFGALAGVLLLVVAAVIWKDREVRARRRLALTLDTSGVLAIMASACQLCSINKAAMVLILSSMGRTHSC